MGPTRRRTRPTIREVAEAAGVSVQTVSRVLNHRPDVAPETFERVQQVIAEIGYAPNMLARSLTSGRSHTLGVVAYGLEYFGPSRLLTGVEREAAATGYSMFLNLIHDPETADADGLLQALFARQVDGVLWTVPKVGDNRAWVERQQGGFPAPLVLLGGTPGQDSLPSVGIDNRAIGCLATQHLLDGGAKTIGTISGPSRWREAQERVQGWRETLVASGRRPDSSLVVEGDWSASSGERAFYELMQQRPEVDAVFAGNDQMALGALRAAHTLGCRVPDDVSLVGVDDIAEASHFWPSLTTVHQPLIDAGAAAVREIDLIIRRSRQSRRTPEAPPSPTLVEPQLIVRESTRPVTSPIGDPLRLPA